MKLYATKIRSIKQVELVTTHPKYRSSAQWITITLYQTKGNHYGLSFQDNISWIDRSATTITEDKFISALALLAVADNEAVIQFIEGE